MQNEPLPAPAPAATSAAQVGVSAWWRALAIATLIVIALCITAALNMFEQFKAQIAHLQVQVQRIPQVKFVAVLLDAQQAPAMLITLDPTDGALQIQRLNDVKEGREDTLQLWAIKAPEASGATTLPVSLGVLPSRAKTVRLATGSATLTGVRTLAISVENKGGVDGQAGPRLPYLYQGAWVRKAL